ncbi:MAG: hypothetical protein EBR59_08575 [Methylococcaceae bacterium]|nr:hypothetical protein [Methylococcaceae bacterium]
MSKPIKIINDGTQIIEREMTDEEFKQWQTDNANAAKAKQEAQAKREAALSKLALLGLDSDDLKALGL